MGRHELIPLDDGERWTAALAGVPHGHALTHGFCRAIQLTSGAPTHLYRYQDGRGRVVCALSERGVQGQADVATPYGFGGFAMSGDCSDFGPAWHDFARERGWVCGYIALNPLFADVGAFAGDELWVHNRLYLLDLREAPERLWARLSQNRRRQLRDWDEIADRLDVDRTRLARFLVENFEEFFARKGGGPATHLTRETVAAVAALDDVLLVGGGDGELESVAAFGYTAHAGDYLFGVSRPGGERHSAHLIWWGVERLRSLEVGSLNLGGGVQEGDELAEFKRRFGASEQPLASLRQVYRPDVYERLCAEAGVSPQRTGWFPPYRARGAGARPAASRAGPDR